MKRNIVVITLFGLLLLGSGFSVSAAPQTMADGRVFDAQWYRGQYSDIDAAYPASASPEDLYEHYVVFGSKEGRLPFEGASNDEAAEGAASEMPGRVIDPSKPMVALTFDDGPYASVGNQIMDCLAQYGGKATFYVVGGRCGNYNEEMQRMAAEGHEIGNHTYNHKILSKLGAEGIQSQIQMADGAIFAASGVPAATVRLPYGSKNATVLENVNAPVIMWSIDTLDWKTRDMQSTVDAVLGTVKDGDIVLMHELYKTTGNAAVQIIQTLTEQGYQLVTVSELAEYRGYELENGKVYYSFALQNTD